nr:O-antigen translocase [Rhizobium sp. Khangiran2]
MTLLKTSILNAIAVGIRILSAMVLNKILAIYVGPAGYAVIGQFQSLVAMLTTFASGAVNTGVTKRTAQYFDDEARQIATWRTAGTICILGGVLAGTFVIVLSVPLSAMVLGDGALWDVFLWLGFSLVLVALNGLLLAIVNGKKQIGLFVLINIAGSVVGLALISVLTARFGLRGALIALPLSQAVVFFVSAALCLRQPWLSPSMLYGRIDSESLRELLKFTAMALTSAVVVPLTQIFIRHHLTKEFGSTSAGFWEALMRISSLYLTVITVPLSVYFMPRLAEIRDASEMKREILHAFRLLVPLTVFGASAIYVLRDFIIAVLFTEEFAPMGNLFGWQMAGDVVKICGWLLGYVLLARGLARPFIITEIVFGAVWYLLVVVTTAIFNVKGAPIAYFLTYCAYFIVLSAYLWSREPKDLNQSCHQAVK